MDKCCSAVIMDCGKAPTRFIDNTEHVKGLEFGGFLVQDGKILLCEEHSAIVVSAMRPRGAIIDARKIVT